MHLRLRSHPYIDGNKRTALLITTVFLSLHGYNFYFPDDVVEFVKSIADPKVEGTQDDMKRITTWIKKGCMINDIFDINENIIYDYFNNTRATFLDKDISVKIRKENS